MSYGVFSAYYDALTENVQYPVLANRIGSLLTRYGIDRGLLLDLGCGTGTLSILLAQKGYEIIGVDRSPDMLAEAQNKAMQSGQNILFLCQDMCALDLYGTIDAAVCTLDGLNHLPHAEAVQTALDRVSLFMNPNGIFILDVNTLYKHREVLGNNTFIYDTDDVYCVWQNTLGEDSATVRMEMDFFVPVSDNKPLYARESEQFSECAYSEEEFENMLQAAGFAVCGKFDGYSENAPHAESERLVYVLRKEKQCVILSE